MPGAVFLSASVPDPKRSMKYAETADPVAIQAAVSALVYVTLGRRILIWGGHPAITPMIWVIAADMGIDYGRWVHLYQSRHFEDEFPEDNERFQNVKFSEDVAGDREKSLLAMRQQMFTENEFTAAVFIGGMGGIIDEFELFKIHQPQATIIPVTSSGGAALEVASRMGHVHPDFSRDLDYVAVFHRHLEIPVQERRYPRPEDQPFDAGQRMWKPS